MSDKAESFGEIDTTRLAEPIEARLDRIERALMTLASRCHDCSPLRVDQILHPEADQ